MSNLLSAALAAVLGGALLMLPTEAGAAEGGGDDNGDRFSFAADRMETVLAEGREHTLLSGNATLISRDTRISAATIELFGEEFAAARAAGGVRVVNAARGIELRSETLEYDRADQIVRIPANAVLVDREHELVIKGGFLEHWEQRDQTIIQIQVRILGEDLVARAEFARYDRGRQTLELSGLPVVTWKGDEFRASFITIDLDAERIELEGAVSGHITSGTETEAAAADPDPAAASSAPADAVPDTPAATAPAAPAAPPPDEAPGAQPDAAPATSAATVPSASTEAASDAAPGRAPGTATATAAVAAGAETATDGATLRSA